MIAAVFDVTLPVFGAILCGYVAVRANWLDLQGGDVLNRFVYRLSFPALLFGVVARTPLDQIFYWPFLLAWLASLAAVYLVVAVVSVVGYRDGIAAIGVRSMNAACPSTAFMGIPLLIYAFGKEAALPAILATTLVVTVFFSITLLMIEMGHSSAASGKPTLRSIAFSLAKNPLMIAVVLGIAASALRITLPTPLARFCEVLGAAAVPCSLVALGVFIARHSIGRSLQGAGVPVFIKLVLHPLLTWLLVATVFQLDPFWAKATILLAALPTATSCFVIAQQHDVIAAESSGTAWLSTLLSILSVSAVLALYGR
jgi:malonate transporter and related proteins